MLISKELTKKNMLDKFSDDVDLETLEQEAQEKETKDKSLASSSDHNTNSIIADQTHHE